MIEEINYNQTIKYTKGLEDGISTSLKAKLSFKDETAPNRVKEVKMRLKWKEKWGPLRKYLEDKKNLSYAGLGNVPNKNFHFRGLEKDLEVKLKENLRKLSLEIEVNSPNNTPRENMLNVEALNTFILTGKDD